ncbi:MAG: peptidase, partial [Bacteroidales bacterium]|nr:peptidase [Bacteroidales bacterium]
EIKKALTTDLFETKISKGLLNNNNSLLIALVPEPGLQQKIDTETRAALEEKKLSMSEEDLTNIMTSTTELIEYQQRSDTPEALATIPMLALGDIEKEAKWYEAAEKKEGEVRVIHYNDFTNGIIYNRLLFDVRVLPQEKLGYVNLLTSLLGKLNTENFEYGVLDNELNIHTGGFSAGQAVYTPGRVDANMAPYIFVESKVMSDKVGKMFDMTGEILFRQILSDKERLSTLLLRHYSDVGIDVENNGMAYASRRLISYFSQSGVYNELTRGLEYYWFLGDIVKRFEADPDAVISEISEVASSLFVRENMTAAVTCNDDDYVKWSVELGRFLETMPSGSAERKEWNLEPVKKNEGILSASKVQYVLQGYNFKDLGYEWSGKLNVLNQVLSTEWLQTQIRVIGGAYGGFTNVAPTGTMLFISYRDPNLKETLDAYKGTVDYLIGFEADEKAMTRFIIGTIAGMDGPETPSMKGNMALTRFLEGRTAAEQQADRDAVLSTTAADISGMSELVKAVLDKNYYCVYGNSDKIEANRNLFSGLISPKK